MAYQPLIRTERHALAAGAAAHGDLVRTVACYRRLVRVLAGIIFVNFPQLSKAPSKCFAVERLFHATAEHPNPRYAAVDRMFHKFPSYLRRAAIEAAFGAVSSYVSNYARWQAGMRSKRTARPPVFARQLAVNPPLYGGQCIRVSGDWASVSIKVLRSDGSWGWTDPLRVKGVLRRLLGPRVKQELSPSLLVSGKKARLACPVELHHKAWPGGDVVCGVDLGMNTGATCAIVDSTGTVRARKFIACARHNDRLDRVAHQIRGRAERTLGPLRPSKNGKHARPGVLSKGFCRELYARARGLNQAAGQELANAIVAFAREHSATSVVFEDLKGFRPKGQRGAGAKRESLRQRLHRWLHRLVVKRAAFRLEELGLKVALVAPRGTSAWAHDGSGEVSRDKKNYSLCTFASGKRYNADLNAALNIAARFIATMLGVTTGDRPASATGKSTGAETRMPIVLADVWRHAGAPV